MARLGIDIGGTFTDFALIRPDGATAVHKRLTTPRDPARAVLEGVAAIVQENDLSIDDITEIVHGTTLVTNALIERRGARVGMLVTQGFRDTFDIGQEQRYDLYDLRLQFAEPLVPRALRAEIGERVWHDGSVLTPLDPAEVEQKVADLVEQQGVEAIAICYMHSYANPDHEEQSRQIVARRFPNLFACTSSDVFPYAREFERWTTTCANAYSQPLVDAYLKRLEQGLEELGYHGQLVIIGSSGGLTTPDTARRFPVRLLESGPAAGVLMSARLGRDLGIDNLLSFDLGGTTAKGALVKKGLPYKTYEFEAARTYKHKSGSGLQLRIPVIDMCEIGSGGGSIVSIDSLNRLRVGPRSASSEPGPACYGRGGQDATLTDANLTLGYLDPKGFLGGRMTLDAGAAQGAISRYADPLNLDVIRAAWGAHDVANEDISRAFRVHATERGFDYRRAVMTASGGGGPLHAARIARKLMVPKVIFPAGAGVMSAFGMLVGAMAFETVRSNRMKIDDLDADSFDAAMAPVETSAMSYLLENNLSRSQITLDRRLDMRYCGQGYDIEIRLPDGVSSVDLVSQLRPLFEAAYRDVFETLLDLPLEIVSWKVEARGPDPDFPLIGGEVTSRTVSKDALKGHRQAYFGLAGGMIDCPVYDRYLLRAGDVVEGPCLVEENESTVLLDAGDTASVHPSGHLMAEIGQA